jgi:hypothetical protein
VRFNESARFAPILALGLLVGCSSEGDDASPPPPDAGLTTAQSGQVYIEHRGCPYCHQEPSSSDVLAGRDTPLLGTDVFPQNLTPDVDTGLGGWTDEQIDHAVRVQFDRNMKPLCFQMPRFDSMPDFEIIDIIAYLRSLPPVKHLVPQSTCPPAKYANDAGPDAG